MNVRNATTEERTAARAICNAAMLDVDDRTRQRSVLLVAVEDDRVLGALVLDDTGIDAIAVRPGRRGQGIGSALVEAAADRCGRLVAEFDPGVRPFYEALGFDISCEAAAGRCRGILARANGESVERRSDERSDQFPPRLE
jgi:GNAT superfamily N-acetyltransferase